MCLKILRKNNTVTYSGLLGLDYGLICKTCPSTVVLNRKNAHFSTLFVKFTSNSSIYILLNFCINKKDMQRLHKFYCVTYYNYIWCRNYIRMTFSPNYSCLWFSSFFLFPLLSIIYYSNLLLQSNQSYVVKGVRCVILCVPFLVVFYAIHEKLCVIFLV